MEKPVIFKNNLGKQLVGILHLPENHGKFPAVIICHGFNGHKTQRKFVELGRELAKNNIVAFRFDFYGSGDSEGNFEKISVDQEVRDLDYAIKFLTKQKIVDKNIIGLIGHSLGALICALPVNAHKEVKALVLLAPALNQKSLIKDWNTSRQIRKWKKQGYNDTDSFRIGVQYLKELEDKNFADMDFISFCPPTLIIQGTKDDTVKPKYARQLFKSLKKPKKLKLIKGGDHNFERYQVRKEMIKETIKWFKKYLK